MPFYKIENSKAHVGNKSHGAEWIEYIVGEEPQELIDGLSYQTPEDISEKADAVKADTLSKLTVTTSSGKVFYADTESRVDLQASIDGADLKGLIETTWKLAEDFEGSRYAVVSLLELREASALALAKKAEVIGVTS